MFDISIRKGITDRKSVVRRQLVIDARADSNPALGNPEYLRVRIDNRKRIRVQGRPVNDGAIVNGSAIDCKKIRCKLAERTLQAATIFLEQEWCLLCGVRIPGIPDVIDEVVVAGTVELIGTGLGENLNSTEAQLVILR